MKYALSFLVALFVLIYGMLHLLSILPQPIAGLVIVMSFIFGLVVVGNGLTQMAEDGDQELQQKLKEMHNAGKR